MTSAAEPRPRQGHELAILLSVAARIEPELMRAVRVTVAPLLDVSAETDLWFGDLVERRGFGYIVLRSDLLPQLRGELTERLKNCPNGAPLHRLWSVIERMHRNGSPALSAEERATWHAVSGGTEAEADIEHALRPALRALVEEARDGVARWFSGAWQRLPEPVRRTTTAWQLATVARARLADAVLQSEPPERLSVTDVGLIAALLPHAELHGRRVGPLLVLGEGADDPGSFVLQVPDTDPQVLDLLDQPVPRTLQVRRAETVAETVGWGPVRLLAADGAVYELPPPALDLSRTGTAPRHGTAPGQHIVLSHAGFDRSWAAWITDQFQSAGHRVTSRLWNPDPSRPLTELLDDLLDTADRALLLVGATYWWLGGRTAQEWDSALTACAADHSGRLGIVIIDAGEPPAAATALPMADLRGTAEQEARHRLFGLLGMSLSRQADEAPGLTMRFPDTPPAVSNAPRRNPRFSGREAFLDHIRHTLLAAPEPGTGRAGQHRCVLLGASGIGKSQLVTEYAQRFGNEYDIVWWISAASQGTAREQLAELAPRLNLAAGQGIGNRIRAVQDSLRVGLPFHRWLVVFDSADDVREIEDLLPEGSGHLLITSRNPAWADDERVLRIDVPPFPRNESIDYIRARAPRLTAAEADRLAEAVQDFPLLLSHTAAWLDTNPMPVPQYIDLVRSHPPGRPPNGHATQYPRALESSWTITLASLRERSPTVVELLDLFTHFSPEAIPVRLLQSADASVLPPRIAAAAADPAAWDAMMRQLSETSAVRLEFGADGVERATMPRLYHALLREQLSDERRDQLSRAACEILAGADPQRPLDAALWTRYAELIPHLEISGSLDRGGIGARLVLNCIEYLRTRGEAHAGLRLCEQARARWRRHRPFDDPDMLIVTYQHANMLRRAGRYREAEAVGRAIVDRISAARPADHPDLQRARNTLGGTLVSLGAYQEAYELYDRTAHINATTLGEEGVATQQARTNLSIVLTLLGRYQEALDLSAAVLAVRSRQLGPHHAFTLYAAHRQALTLRLLGRYAYALGRQESNVHDYRRLIGRYTVTTMVAEHNLAQCLRRVGDLTPARDLMRELVERARQVQGPQHPEALFIAADYASLLREDRSLDQSWDLATTAARGYADLLGDTHPYSIGTAGNIGLILQNSGDRDRGEARRVAERALRGMTASMGADHPWTIGCALNAASARSHSGDAEGAADLSGQALERATNAVGRSHPLALACEAALAQDLRALRRGAEADQLQQDALTRLTGTLGEHSPQTAAVRRGERPFWDFEPQPT
ncbi:FxSxx-COOH system tetratricopeptide repeat protein [Streptomyces sp. NBC_01750]|uniref:FxSxx-COOH system tetratricopeptide repeat protein n=1 Tax=Streptomyces sp. NBC_01750 TaxID=2975928 RepID=UPI002DDC22F9|nr:FxSxx-COOH system tetratricopeptide repeat protein [Streptomyces sp. NBC_01750]WSD30670.1 FxSxx-COOH system tetratricopeptide repeat protein [Streptomyces sp. NBC_01750]